MKRNHSELSAKQKAIILVQKVAHLQMTDDEANRVLISSPRIAHLIVDEILREVNRLDSKFSLGLKGTNQYWEAVKTEIDNI